MDNQDSTVDFDSRFTRLGIFTTALAIITNFFPVAYLYFGLGVSPGMDIFKILAMLTAIYGAAWITMPISYFPTLGTCGSYIGWISGSVSDIRLPAATMAQKVSGYEAGTPEGDVAATMGIAVSVFVSILIVSFFTVIGTGILPLLPKFVTDSFAYIVPAIFSAVFAELSSKDYVLGVLVFAAAIIAVVVAPQLGVAKWAMMPLIILLAVFIASTKFKLTKK